MYKDFRENVMEQILVSPAFTEALNRNKYVRSKKKLHYLLYKEDKQSCSGNRSSLRHNTRVHN